jgi:hypothetical protein
MGGMLEMKAPLHLRRGIFFGKKEFTTEVRRVNGDRIENAESDTVWLCLEEYVAPAALCWSDWKALRSFPTLIF